ncbi:MAG: 2-dehydropantoate 2-reductase [Proteobacteria bacterium]|jgi:2-dehydropantoate 2-reductase|nr:2-dehydropantoate 2-reductase [Pseudomonadota bacterium]HJP07197.1 2-dehydropantoate 2-reductase [Arenicellales bacterium]|tara:strand:+ start:2243 stop:3169 length:927 start_codon:yes stop_codon:yes gene_type:complete
MKIAIIGAGAMGSVYAALLADAGNEVWAIDLWREHLDAIRDRGLQVSGASGERTVANIRVSTDATDAGPCDLVVIATKASSVGTAARSLINNLTEKTLVLTIQNGLGAGERISDNLDSANILLGVAGGFGASIPEPGHVHHNGMELIRLGEMHGGITERLEGIARVWQDAGFNVKTFDDINQLIWEKFICNVALSGAAAAFDRTLGEVMADPVTWGIAKNLGLEAYRAGKAKGIHFSFEDPVQYISNFGSKMPDARPSMLLDLKAKRLTEVDAINGMVPVIAKQQGLEAPYNEVITAMIKAKESAFSD